jgi:crotonobetainyl-CoA:carnitine CoA-transferase CaiB-like acyl-CoA transferase
MSSPGKFWRNLLQGLGVPELESQPIFADRDARIANHEEIYQRLEPIFGSQPIAFWKARFVEHEVPHSEVATPASVLASQQAQHLGLEVTGQGPKGQVFRTIRNPLSFDGERMDTVVAPPLLGQDNGTVLSALATTEPVSTAG